MRSPSKNQDFTGERRETVRQPLEIEALADFDADLDDMIEVDPYNREPSSRRSDKQISKLLDILDNLPRGKDAK